MSPRHALSILAVVLACGTEPWEEGWQWDGEVVGPGPTGAPHTAGGAPDATILTGTGELPRLLMTTAAGVETLALDHTAVRARVTGHVARVEVRQRYENRRPHAVEAVYVFPLPENAAVDDFSLVVGQRTIEGAMRPRAEARDTFERARRAGHTAALLEQARPNVFTQTVTNIPPRESVEVVVRYVQTLTYDAGTYEFVFPMVVAPRYRPGGAAAPIRPWPEAGAAAPTYLPEGMRSGRDVSLSLEIDAGLGIRRLEAPTHAVELGGGGPRLTVRLAGEDTVPNRDFVFRWKVAGAAPLATVLAHKGERGGFFTLILQPPDLDVDGLVGRRELVFVVDVSGSMSGLPLWLAKETMREALTRLRPVDTFEVLTFAGKTRRAFAKPRKATPENVAEAMAVIDGLEARGGTEMRGAVEAALSRASEDGRHRYVVFLTDGHVDKAGGILAATERFVEAAKARGERARVFGVGLGSAPNRYLLEGLGTAGRGISYHVSNREAPVEAVERVFRLIDHPIVEDVRLDFGSLDVHGLQPARSPDLFLSRPLVFHGRYDRGGAGTVVLAATTPEGRRVRREIAVELPDEEPRHGALASLWARARVGELMASAWHGEGVTAEVTRLGLDFRIMTPYTSFVAVDGSRVVGDGRPTAILQPVDAPEDLDVEAAGGRRATVRIIGSLPPVDSVRPRPPATAAPRDEQRFGKREGERRVMRTGLLAAMRPRDRVVELPGGRGGGLGRGDAGAGDPTARVIGDLRAPPASDDDRRPRIAGAMTIGVGGLGVSRTPRDVSQVEAGPVAVLGGLEEAVIERIVRHHHNELRYCYERERIRHPHVYGAVSLIWVIDAAGRVAQASIHGTTMGNADVEACLTTRLRRWVFPAPKGGGIVQVTQRFTFRPPGRGGGEAGATQRALPAPRGTLQVRTVTARGLDPAAAERVVRRHRDELRSCYARALRKRPGLSGTARVGWLVGPTGTVPGATLHASTLDDEALEACLLARVRAWSFPFGAATAEVLQAWRFEPGPSPE